VLNLKLNQIGAEGAQAIGEALQINQVGYKFNSFASITSLFFLRQTLTTLNLEENQMENTGAQVIGQALERNQVRYKFYVSTSITNVL